MAIEKYGNYTHRNLIMITDRQKFKLGYSSFIAVSLYASLEIYLKELLYKGKQRERE